MIRWAIARFARHDRIDAVVPVIAGDHRALFSNAVHGVATADPVLGGETRQDSVRLGLEALAANPPDFVLIHDAARPLVSGALITRVCSALAKGAHAAVPLVPVADTLRKKRADGWTLVSRDDLYRAQTPQGFRFAPILDAHRRHRGDPATDDMALAERAGIPIEAVPGEERNFKVTTADDFGMAEPLLDKGDIRTGLGYDAHRFAEGNHVWLCGVKIAHDHALEGHSDADAGLHALTDAILGAMGAGDIGQHFPPTDERWRGAPSAQFLAHAASLVQAKGGRIVHCDVTLICERPKIGPHRDAMRARIAEILDLVVDRVSVKATTTDGMGFTGRREGLAAQAVATVKLP